MHPDSICRLCLNPNLCPLCAIMRDPKPLTARDIAHAARVFARPAPVRTMAEDRALVRAAVASIAPIAGVKLQVADPEKTAPAPESRDLQPAPAPLPAPAPVKAAQPARGVSFPLTLKRGDWAGLAARVEAGVTSQAEAERIGAEWMAGATARA